MDESVVLAVEEVLLESSLLLLPLLLRLVVLNVVGVLIEIPVPTLELDGTLDNGVLLALSVSVVPLEGGGYVLEGVVADDEVVEEIPPDVELASVSLLGTVTVYVVSALVESDDCVALELKLPDRLLKVTDPFESLEV